MVCRRLTGNGPAMGCPGKAYLDCEDVKGIQSRRHSRYIKFLITKINGPVKELAITKSLWNRNIASKRKC